MFAASAELYVHKDPPQKDQRIVKATDTVEEMDRTVTLFHEEGGPMRTSEGPLLFARPFCNTLKNWSQKMWQMI